jgi:XTP/dITP diphosphohydrolase
LIRSEADRVDEEGSNLVALVDLMARLRAECGWKAAQTHRTLARHLLEETYEAIEAIESGQGDGEIDDEHLAEELGDVLLQVYFHAAIAAESGRFDIEDVAAGLREKLIRRNPHVFGEVEATDPAEINEHWERIKAAEKQRSDLLEGIPPTLPALARAAKVLDRLDRAGRPLPAEVSSSDDLGDRLLALVAESRAEGLDPEQALRDAVRRLGS